MPRWLKWVNIDCFLGNFFDFLMIPIFFVCAHQIGMDSLMAVEIKQVIDREFDVNLTAQDLRTLTFAKLQELTDSKAKDETPSGLKSISLADLQKNMLFRSLGDEATADQTIIQLNDIPLSGNDSCALLIPGVEGVMSPIFRKMASFIQIPVYGLQTHCTRDEIDFVNVVTMLANVSGFLSNLLSMVEMC